MRNAADVWVGDSGLLRLTICNRNYRFRKDLAVINYLSFFLPLGHDLYLLKYFRVVSLFEGVELSIIGLTLAEDPRLSLVLELAL